MRLVSVLVAAATLAACAPTARLPALDPNALQVEAETQRRLFVEQHLADLRQLHHVVYPILAANVELCGRHLVPATGLLLKTAEDEGWSFAGAARAAGLSEALTVVGIADGSPAQRAGLAEGDRIVTAAGVALGVGRQAHETFAALLQNTGGASLTLTVERAGERHAATLSTEPVCDMPYRVMLTEAINAYANGRELMVTSGLLRFLGNDAEIAVIVGHEIAHNVMGHDTASVPGMAALYDFFGFGAKPAGAGDRAAQPLNQVLEAEADYVGMYLMARAGFPVDGAANVYRRFAVSAPVTILARERATHPSSPARVVMLNATAREIDAKRAAGLPLLPESKKE